MSGKPEVKICGLTNLPDANLAAELGAQWLGFIFYSKSPRSVDLPAFRALRDQLPAVKRVYVQVRPEADELKMARDEGFDCFQLHVRPEEDVRLIDSWLEIVGRERLWLAPKVAPEEEFPHQFLEFTETFLIDTYRKGSFGGTGETGDWGRFREWSERNPQKKWILAGGLKPENLRDALQQTGTTAVDAASGIEERPGKKDHERMKAFFQALADAR